MQPQNPLESAISFLIFRYPHLNFLIGQFGRRWSLEQKLNIKRFRSAGPVSLSVFGKYFPTQILALTLIVLSISGL